MDHLVIPLDSDHLHAWSELVGSVASAAGLTGQGPPSHPHVTLIAHSLAPPGAVLAAVEQVAAVTATFAIRAHGYGFFTGKEPHELSLHVPVVRSAALDALHGQLCAALRRAGAQVARWSEPELWSPHITLLDRDLAPATLGQAATWLAQRHHPSWRIPVDRLALTGGWSERDRLGDVIRLEGKSPGGGGPRANAGAACPWVGPVRKSELRPAGNGRGGRPAG